VNEDEFESLRRWGDALVDDPRPEVRAAGKAILLLAAEIERLQLELWHARLGIRTAGDGEPAGVAPAPDVEAGAEDHEPEELPSVLARLASKARRLQPDRFLHRN
jgi:hypothetical protein